MNLIGYWHKEDQTRVGELERRPYDEKKTFASKVTEASVFPKRLNSASWKWKTSIEKGKS